MCSGCVFQLQRWRPCCLWSEGHGLNPTSVALTLITDMSSLPLSHALSECLSVSLSLCLSLSVSLSLSLSLLAAAGMRWCVPAETWHRQHSDTGTQRTLSGPNGSALHAHAHKRTTTTHNHKGKRSRHFS